MANIDIDYYRKISGSYNTFNKQEQQRNSVASNFINNFNSSIAYEDVFIDGVAKGAIIQKAGIQNNIRNIYKITMKPNDNINVGSIVKWEDKNWLCFQADNVHGIYEYGNIQQCKHTLKYYDTLDNLYETSCVIYSGTINEDENKFINLSNDEYIIYCPDNVDTSHINLNTRFVLNKNVYKILGIDNLTKVGLLIVKVQKCEITVDDNMELEIADWGKHQANVINTSDNDVIEIIPKVTTIRANKTMILTAHYISNNVEDLSKHFTWTLLNADGSENTYANIISNDKTCSLTAGSIVNKNIIIRATLIDDINKYTDIKLKIVSLF